MRALTKKQQAELRSLEKRDGTLSPQRVVEFARNKRTELHKRFDWDDTKAAEKWRLYQARAIIQVVVNVIDTRKGPIESRAYVSLDRDRGKNGYRTIVSVLDDPELRAELLEQAKNEAHLWSVRYKELTELARIHDAIKQETK